MTAPTRGSAGRVSFDIDGDPFREDIERTAVFGLVDTEHGRGRTALPVDTANGWARDYLVSRLEAVGLDVHIDAIGSTTGRQAPDGADPDAVPVVTGSHLDSAPNGGIFGRLLGVYVAVETVRSIRENGLVPTRPLEVVCFTGEEGTRFADSVLGLTAIAGKRGVGEVPTLTDDDMTFENTPNRVGCRGSGRLDASAWDVQVEPHIEQNTCLGDAGAPLGIVTGITGTARRHASTKGQADHSGTTEMTACHDVLAIASELVLKVERRTAGIATTGSDTTIGTIDKLGTEPNVANIIPGVTLPHPNFRSADREEIRPQLDAAERTLDMVETHRDVATLFDCTYDVPPTPLSEYCRWVVTEASHACDIEMLPFHSGAGRDTIQVADMTDTTLVFVASENGYSHSPREQAGWADRTVVTEVLAGTFTRLVTTDDTEMDNIERS